jgi:acetyl-CoA C-acetyltransferase
MTLWLAAGLRTPFAKVDGPLAALDAIQLSVPVVQAMCAQLKADRPDLVVWGAVAPSLRWSNIAREVVLDAGLDPHTPAFTTVMACSTSMQGVFAAAAQLDRGPASLALVGGAESMSRVQIGLSQKLSDWLRRFFQAKSLGQRAEMLAKLPLHNAHLHIPSVTNRTTGKSMGEGTEEMAKTWRIPRHAQDELALTGHRRAVAAQAKGFFDDLILPVAGLAKDTIPRGDTSLDKLARLPPAFDRTSGNGTLTAGNSSPLTDGAAALWLANDAGLGRLPAGRPRVKLIDWELGAVDMERDGLLMAPAFAVPRLLARHGLRYDAISLWEIHEAFAAQVLCHVAAFEDEAFLKSRAGVSAALGTFPWDRFNPNGGSVALGHPFGATGARILSQAVKELAAMPAGSLGVVSICADGGLGTVALLQAA